MRIKTLTDQSVKREYQQDAIIQMFIVNFRCLLLTTVSTCFGQHYAHHQENKDRVLLHMVFALVVLDVAGYSRTITITVLAPYNGTPHNCNYQRKHQMQ